MELSHHRPEGNSMSGDTSKPKKQRRISRACDFCHRRSIRCRPSAENDNRCQNCSDFGADCTFNRPFKRRGNQPHPSSHGLAPVHASLLSQPAGQHFDQCEQPYDATHKSAETIMELRFSFDLREDHQALILNNVAKIQDLITVYFESVYPM
jgi:hypothetical protein